MSIKWLLDLLNWHRGHPNCILPNNQHYDQIQKIPRHSFVRCGGSTEVVAEIIFGVFPHGRRRNCPTCGRYIYVGKKDGLCLMR